MSNLTKEELRKWRREKNFSQVEMGQFLGVHRGTLSKYESGALDVPFSIVDLYKKDIKLNKSPDVKNSTTGLYNKTTQLTPQDIKAWRDERNLNQRQLGKIIGCNRRTVSDYENGSVAIPPYMGELFLAHDEGRTFVKPNLVSEGKTLIKEKYKEIVLKKGSWPQATDFTVSELNKIEYHFRNMRKLHDEMREDSVVSSNIFKIDDILCPTKKSKFDKVIRKHKRLFITTAIMMKDVHYPFLEAIKTYCNKNDAALIILVTRDSGAKKDSDGNDMNAVLDPILDDPNIHIVYEDTIINDNLFILDMKVNAKQVNPISSLERVCKINRSSGIVGSPKQFLKFVAMGPQTEDHPYAITTTGAITVSDYTTPRFSSLRTSYIADLDHIIGGIIVEKVNKKKFHFRHVQANREDGSFIDLGKEYHSDGSVSDRPAVLIMGDYHAGQTDPNVKKATKSICSDVNVIDIVVHDFYDGLSINHHDKDNIGLLAIKAEKGLHNLRKELEHGADELGFLQSLIPGKIVVVKSNHDEVLDRYLNAGRYHKDPVNFLIATELHLEYVRSENSQDDILSLAYKKCGRPGAYDPERIEWLRRDESYIVGGIELGMHGDIGSNGSGGNLVNFDTSVGPCVIGHSHHAGILRSVYQVGTSSVLDLGYNKGPNNWTHTHCLLYENGSRQLINMFNGEWRLQ